MRCSFIVPLLSSHSLIRYGESVLTERALITVLNRSSDPLRVCARAPFPRPKSMCLCLCTCGCATSYDTREIEKYQEKSTRWINIEHGECE